MTNAVTTGDLLDKNPSNTAIATYNGNVFDILDESTWDFDIDDIGRALSNIGRFAGHVDFYSVAEHSCRVAEILRVQGYPATTQLLGLLHDGTEAFLMDVPRPFKPLFSVNGEPYRELEARMEHTLFMQYGLLTAFDRDWDAVKAADMEAYRVEHADRPSPADLTPSQAYSLFMYSFQYLSETAYREEMDA